MSENVVTPATLTLSKFVWPSTSKSRRRLKLPLPVNLACSNPLPPTTPLNTKLPAVDVLPVSFQEIIVFLTLVLKNWTSVSSPSVSLNLWT